MSLNVFTKKEILQNLASKGCFIDAYTLDAFFAKKKIDAIFEDPQGNELYDNNAFNTVLEDLFNNNQNAQPQIDQSNIETNNADPEINTIDNININNDASLSDDMSSSNRFDNFQDNEIPRYDTAQTEVSNTNLLGGFEDRQSGESLTQEVIPSDNIQSSNSYNDDATFDIGQDDLDINGSQDSASYDDITLLSESFEAQEKLRQYVMSELSKNNMDVTPQTTFQYQNNTKLDISEKTFNMIARAMAKKIAKYVGSIMAQDAKRSARAAQFEVENRKLARKARELEEQNRKLRLLLAESNKNLNSYKPSLFGLYKKIDSKTKK